MVVGSRIHCSIFISITLLAAYWCQIGYVFVASFVIFEERRNLYINYFVQAQTLLLPR